MPLDTIAFDAAEYLDTAAAQAELIDDALASGDATYVAHALDVVARARGMVEVARDAGLSHEAFDRARGDGLALATVLKITRALGLRLTALPLAS